MKFIRKDKKQCKDLGMSRWYRLFQFEFKTWYFFIERPDDDDPKFIDLRYKLSDYSYNRKPGLLIICGHKWRLVAKKENNEITNCW